MWFYTNKHLIYAVDRTTAIGHTAYIDYNTNYNVTVLMMSFISSWCKLLEIDASREICNYVTWVKHFLPNVRPKFVMFLTAQLENA